MKRLCKGVFSACIDHAVIIFFKLYLLTQERILWERTIHSSEVFDDASTHSTEIEECFDNWLRRVCQDLKRGDPTIDEVEIDHHGEVHTFNEDDMQMLTNALATNKVVTRLKFRRITIDKKSSEVLKSMLQPNTNALTDIHLEQIRGTESIVATSLTLALHPMTSIQSLHLIGNCIDIFCSKAIGLMLSSNRSLKEFRLCQSTIDDEGLSHISLGLMSNKSIKILDLEGNALSDASVSKICNALGHNETLEFLRLDFNDFATSGTRAIASLLQRNSTIMELHLFGNHIDSVGATAISSSLCHNLSLKKLILSFNNIGDDGAKALAKVLTVNHTLTHLSIPSNSIWIKGFKSFGFYVPRMKGLEVLNIGELYDTQAADALLKGLKCNTRLSNLYLQLPICDEYYTENDGTDGTSSRHMPCTTQIEEDIEFFLRLNKSGRSILHSPEPIPSSMWAEALGKASKYQNWDGAPDVLYHLLRGKPDLLSSIGG